VFGCRLNIVVGLAGLLDLGCAASHAVGAHGSALLARLLAIALRGGLPLAGLCSAIRGIIPGLPERRLRLDRLALVTLASREIIRTVLLNRVSLTGPPNGMRGIPRPSLFGLPFFVAAGEGSFTGFFRLEPSRSTTSSSATI